VSNENIYTLWRWKDASPISMITSLGSPVEQSLEMEI